MSRHLYKQYVRLAARWPKDQFKHQDRDLAYFMPKEIDRQFAPDAIVSIESGLCERRLQALEDLCANKVMTQYPNRYTSGVFGLNLQQLQEASSDENRKHFGLAPKNNIFKKAWRFVFPTKEAAK